MKTPKYKVVLSERLKDSFGILIEDGEYQNVFISIGTIKTNELDDSVSIEEYVVYHPDSVSNDMLSSEEFLEIKSNIITEILEEVFLDPTRDNDTQTLGA